MSAREDAREALGISSEDALESMGVDAEALESVGEAREAALVTIIDCKGRGLNRVDCMMACAVAGIPCTPALRHPHPETRPNAGEGDLFRCSKSVIGPTCSYLYGNGDMCFVIRGSAWVPCTYGGG
jgi:hypothetical protein